MIKVYDSGLHKDANNEGEEERMEPEGGFDSRLSLAETLLPLPDEILLRLVACPHPKVSYRYTFTLFLNALLCWVGGDGRGAAAFSCCC